MIWFIHIFPFPRSSILLEYNYLWVQALLIDEELQWLRGDEPNNPHQRFLWKIIRLGVINPEAIDKLMDASTRSMRHSSAIGMTL